MPHVGRDRSGTATANTRPDPDHLTHESSDRAQEAGRRSESPHPGIWTDPSVASAAVLAPNKSEVGENGTGRVVPQLAPGVERLGEYKGSGLTEATYLVRNPCGQVVHLSRLLDLVLSGIDGSRTAPEIADCTTAAFDRTVSAGNVEYLLTNKLAPLGLLTTSELGRPGARPADQDPAILALKVRQTLIPASAVQHLARLFRPLFSPLVVVSVLACLIASDAWLFRSARLGPAFRFVLLHPLLLLLVLGLSVLSMLFHECGHAAACRYGGARPGVIGMGFYVVWPAFFTNVTDSYRLGRAGRIRTDLGGVYFNAIFVLLLMMTYLETGYVPLLAAILAVHLEIVQQLLPTLRLDGYFILTDLIGVPDLFQRIRPTLRSMIPGRPIDPRARDLKRAARVTLTAWVLLVVPLLTAELILIILNIPSLATTFAHSLDGQAHAVVAEFGRIDVPAGLVSVISVLLLLLPMAGLCYILLITGRRTLRLAVRASRRRPMLGYGFAAAALLAAAALAIHWGILPLGGSGATPLRPAGATTPGGATTGQPGGSGGSSGNGASALSAAAAARDQAAAWVVQDVNSSDIIACDPAMCSALKAQGLPAGRLLPLQPAGADPFGADVIVASLSVRNEFGSQLTDVYAPALIASFGSGSGRIDIRAIADHGGAAYRAAEPSDLATRKAAGAQLLQNQRFHATAQAASQITAGQVDSRVLVTLAWLVAQRAVNVTAFSDTGPGAPTSFRQVTITSPGGQAPDLTADLDQVLAQRAPYLPESTTIVHLGSQTALRIEFGAPSLQGLLSVETVAGV